MIETVSIAARVYDSNHAANSDRCVDSRPGESKMDVLN